MHLTAYCRHMHLTRQGIERPIRLTFPDPPRWAYPLNEAAEQLGCSLDTVKRLINDGKLTYVQDGPKGRRRIEGTEIARYLESIRHERDGYVEGELR